MWTVCGPLLKLVLGRTPSQYPPDYITWRKKHTHNSDSALPGGESLRAFAERALEAATIAHDLATENGLVLIVSHRLLMGAVAALHRSCRHHADIFGYASDFHLVPAHLWAAPPREITWSTIARMSASCRTSRITSSPSAVAGRFALTDGYLRHLYEVLDTHEQGEHLSHIRRTLIVQGDVRETLPRYLTDNPHTVIALAYFDLDLYEPTRDTITAIRPYLTKGSVLTFDELAHAKWPGETAALRDTLGTDHGNLRLLPGCATPVYLRWST